MIKCFSTVLYKKEESYSIVLSDESATLIDLALAVGNHPIIINFVVSAMKSTKHLKVFNVDGVTLTSEIMMLYKKINIESKKIINFRVTSLSNYCCQNSILVRGRPGILVIFICFLSYFYDKNAFI